MLKHKKKSSGSKITILIRLLLFVVFFFFAINYLSQNKNTNYLQLDKTISIDESIKIKQILPDKSLQIIDQFPNQPIILFLQDKLKFIEDQLQGFPGKQIKEIKVEVVERVYQAIMKNINSSK